MTAKLMKRIEINGKGPLPNIQATMGFDGPITTVVSGAAPLPAFRLIERLTAAYSFRELLDEAISNAERLLVEAGVLASDGSGGEEG